MIYGFIGTGKIASAVIEGICKSENRPDKIIVSPRNAEKAKSLSDKFELVEVASSNQEVVDNSDITFITLRPPQAPEILTQIKFRNEQKIVSLIPTIPFHKISEMVKPAQLEFRAIPLPPVSIHNCPVAYYPQNDLAKEIFGEIGDPISFSDEHQLHVIWAATGLISPFYEFLNTTAQWAIDNGVEPSTAEKYTAEMYSALANYSLHKPENNFAELADDAATPGGLNEQAVKMMTDDGAFKSLRKSLDAILDRFEAGIKK